MERFDEMLNDEEMRVEYDRRLAQEIDGARAQWDVEFRRGVEAAIAEYSRQAGMSDEERMAERAKALDERERAVERMELRARAAQLMAARGLPSQLADYLAFEDAVACDQGIEALDRAFREAVQAEVMKKLGGERPVMGMVGRAPAEITDEQYYSGMMDERI